MEKYPVTPRQLQRLQADYSRLKRADDPRTWGPDGTQFSDDRDGRLAWARAHLGFRLESFSDLSASSAAYLLDILAGVPTKLDLKLRSLFGDNSIAHPEEWFVSMQARSAQFKFQGAPLHQLNRWQKHKLAELLVSRLKAGAREQTSASAPAPARRQERAVHVNHEQRTLWWI